MSQGATTTTRIHRAALAAARLLPLVLLLGLAACVSGGKYRAALQERDATLAKNAELKSQLEALENQTVGLQSELDQQNGELSQMRGTYDALVTELQSELESGQVEIQRLRDGIRVNLAQEILFPTGSAELDEKGREILLRVSEQLANVKHRIEVEGHTDSRGNATYNMRLSQSRAETVREYLLANFRLKPDNLVARGYGETRLETRERNEEEYLRNRRVILRVLNPEVLPGGVKIGRDE